MSRRVARCLTNALLQTCVSEAEVAASRCAPAAVLASTSRACPGQTLASGPPSAASAAHRRASQSFHTSASAWSAPSAEQAAEAKDAEQAPQDQVSAMATKVMQDAAEHANNGHPERASEMLEAAEQLLSEALGRLAPMTVSVRMTHQDILLRHGLFEKLSEVSEAVATELSERADMVVQFAYNQLRWACAQMGEGKLQGAQDNLLSGIQSLETGLRNKEGIPSELAAELMFYAALLQLYASRDAADVAEIGQHMRQAVRSLAQDAVQYGAAEAPMLAPALRAHFQSIEAAIDDDEPAPFISALFELLIQLHQDGGTQAFVTAHVRHAYAVWWCMHGGSPARAKAELAAAQAETREAAAAAQRRDPGGAELPDEARESFTFQEVQLRARVAICDTMLAYSGEMGARVAGGTAPASGSPADSPAASVTKSELSSCAALFDDMVGEENALAAECRFCLGLWGVVEGLDWEEGGAAASALQRNLQRQLGVMADAFPAGRGHFIVAGLAKLYEQRFGAMEWPEEEAAAGEGGAHASCGHDHGSEGGAHVAAGHEHASEGAGAAGAGEAHASCSHGHGSEGGARASSEGSAHDSCGHGEALSHGGDRASFGHGPGGGSGGDAEELRRQSVVGPAGAGDAAK